MRLTLTLFDPTALIGGPTVSRSFDRTGGTIGRADSNDWVLPDPGHHLSDQHCRIEYGDGGYTLVDTSTTGVYVNEATEALGFGNARALTAGDRIALGDYLVAVAFDDGAVAAPAESLPPNTPPFAGTPFVAPIVEPSAPGAPPDAAPGPQSPPPPRARPEDRLPSSGREAVHAGSDVPSDPLTLDPVPGGRRKARAGVGGVDEFVGAFLDGAGVEPTELPRDQALQMIARAGVSLREAVAGLHQVVRARTGTRRGLRTSADNPLTGASDTSAALANLLGMTGAPAMSAEHAIREVVTEIRSQAPPARATAARLSRVALALALVLTALGGAAAYLEFGPSPRTAAVSPAPVASTDTAPATPEPAPATAAAPTAVELPPPAPTSAAPTPPVVAPSTAAVASAPAAPPPAPAVDRVRVRGALSELFRSFPCANLTAEIGDDGTVMLTGLVSRDDELTRLTREVSALPHVPRVDNRATVEPWPFCEVERLLSTQTAGGPTAPQIEASHADRTYHEGDALIVTAINHTRDDSYLYVDFFDTDGKVVHMLPTALRANNRVAANQRVALGTTSGKAARDERVYVIAPPFGTGLVIALSSARPLFAEPRPEQEDVGAYLAALAGALVRDPAGAGSAARVTSSHQAITLVAR